jgi:hypothetical protein
MLKRLISGGFLAGCFLLMGTVEAQYVINPNLDGPCCRRPENIHKFPSAAQMLNCSQPQKNLGNRNAMNAKELCIMTVSNHARCEWIPTSPKCDY